MTITQQQIIALAVEAGLAEAGSNCQSLPGYYSESLANFAALAYQRGVRDEREACAKVCEHSASKAALAQVGGTELVSMFLGQRVSALTIAADRIRARSDK